MSMALLYLTSLQPILKTYKPSKIIPFSLNTECLLDVESAMIQPISSRFFYDYLKIDIEDNVGLTFFAMYADIRRFLGLCDKMSRFRTSELQDQINEHAV